MLSKAEIAKRYRERHPERTRAYAIRPDVSAKRREYTRLWREKRRAIRAAEKAAAEPARLEKKKSQQRARNKRWYARNAEKSKAISVAYARANRERLNAKNRERYKNDASYRARVLIYSANRTRFQKQGTLTAEQWGEIWDRHHGLCVYCCGTANSMDHVIPVVAGGKHEADNVVPSCKSCNSSKRSRSLLTFIFRGGLRRLAA